MKDQDDVARVMVTLTRLDNGDIRVSFERVGSVTWGVEALASMVYGDGDEVEDVRIGP